MSLPFFQYPSINWNPNPPIGIERKNGEKKCLIERDSCARDDGGDSGGFVMLVVVGRGGAQLYTLK